MYNNFHWCQMIAHEKIADARNAAVQDRLALTATQAGREAQRCERAPFARLLSVLAGAFGLCRPALLRERVRWTTPG